MNTPADLADAREAVEAESAGRDATPDAEPELRRERVASPVRIEVIEVAARRPSWHAQ